MKPGQRRKLPPRAKTQPAAKPLASRRLWLFRLTALLLPIILLGVLELALRLCGYGFDPHFFKPYRIGGEDYLVQNDDFSFRFFPRETARNPGALRMEALKPPRTFRIFILGESAAMGDPQPAYGPARYLEIQLRDRFPDLKFEVVNTAFTAINSHVIVPIARECAAHEGDLWIIYMGNNEMVGPFGAATVFGWQAPPLPYVRLGLALQRLRIGQWLMEQGRKLRGQATPTAAWGGMEMFLNHEVAPDSPRKETVYANFQKNLDEIVRAGINSGARVLLNTVAVNLKDCPPFASLPNRQRTSAEPAQFDQLYTNGIQAAAQNDFAGAARLFGQAAKLDDQFAELQFHWGESLLAQKDFSAAREHLQLACDDDALPFRTDSRLNAIIAAAGKKFAGDRLVLLDAAAVLAAQTPDGVCGTETFYEHVHFNFDGSYRLGLAWARQVEKMLPSSLARANQDWLSPKQCDERLGLPDWVRAETLEHMAERMQVPPFTSQANNPQRVERLLAGARQLVAQAHADTNYLAETREIFRRPLERAPDDFLLHENYAAFLHDAGDLPQATAEWRRAQELIPHDYLPLYELGRLLGEQGRWTEAEADLRAALAIRPGASEVWMDLGQTLAAQGRYDDALACYAVAQRQQPQNEQPVLQAGNLHAQLNQTTAAIQCYREAIRLKPGDWEPHFQLGRELDSAGQLDEARDEFAATVKLNPNFPGGRLFYGVQLAKLGRLGEAQRELTEALRLEPDNPNTRGALARVQALLQRRSSN